MAGFISSGNLGPVTADVFSGHFALLRTNHLHQFLAIELIKFHVKDSELLIFKKYLFFSQVEELITLVNV